jgi:hypothetical protein
LEIYQSEGTDTLGETVEPTQEEFNHRDGYNLVFRYFMLQLLMM